MWGKNCAGWLIRDVGDDSEWRKYDCRLKLFDAVVRQFNPAPTPPVETPVDPTPTPPVEEPLYTITELASNVNKAGAEAHCLE